MKQLRMCRAAWCLVAVVLCALLAPGLCVAAEKTKAPAAKKASPEKAPAKAKAKTKTKTKSKSSGKAAAKKADDTPPHPSKLPWTLRGHYSIAYGNTTMIYSTDNVEWRLFRDKEETIIDNVGMTITLGDGSVMNVVEFTKGATDFKDINDESGKYRQFWVEMAPKNGLTLRHSIARYTDRPYMLMRSTIKNTGDKPVTIREVAPVVFGPNGMVLSPDATMTLRPVARRGGYVVYTPGQSGFAVFNDPAKKFLLAMGLFPETSTPGALTFKKGETNWQGKITCDYNPGRVLKPGEILEVQPLLLVYFMPKPSDLDTGFAMAIDTLPAAGQPAPLAWVTAGPKDTAAALLATAEQWSKSDVECVLVPAPYSGPEGYPYDPKQMVSAIKGLKMKPGIAVDPLAVQGAPENLSVAGPNGRRWLNPTLPEAREYAAGQLKALCEYGYTFFVVPPSVVPDEALTAIGISRGDADALAFEIAASAAGERPVVPSAVATLGSEVEPWLEADAATARLRVYGASIGPVRVDAAKLGEPSDGLAMAMAMYPGPIELVGAPSKRAKSLFPRPVTFALPVDCAQQAPKLWQAQEKIVRSASKNVVVAYPGAPVWTEADLSSTFEGKPKSLVVDAGGKISEAKP